MGKGSQAHRAKPPRKARRALGHSRAGRPRKSGERYESGRLKPPEANEKVIAARRALLGDAKAQGRRLAAAENPLDLMLARGWLTAVQHQAGKRFAEWRAKARLGQAAIKTSRLERGARAAPAAGDPVALWRLAELSTGLGAAERSALMDVCVLEIWPRWVGVLARITEPAVGAALLAGPGPAALKRGLDRVAEISARATPGGLSSGSNLSVFAKLIGAGL